MTKMSTIEWGILEKIPQFIGTLQTWIISKRACFCCAQKTAKIYNHRGWRAF